MALALPTVAGPGVLQADHRRATGHQDREGLPASRMAEDGRTQRSPGLQGLRSRGGDGSSTARALPAGLVTVLNRISIRMRSLAHYAIDR